MIQKGKQVKFTHVIYSHGQLELVRFIYIYIHGLSMNVLKPTPNDAN